MNSLFSCPNCFTNFAKKTDLIEHNITEHGLLPDRRDLIQCQYCLVENFIFKRDYDEHIKKEHSLKHLLNPNKFAETLKTIENYDLQRAVRIRKIILENRAMISFSDFKTKRQNFVAKIGKTTVKFADFKASRQNFIHKIVNKSTKDSDKRTNAEKKLELFKMAEKLPSIIIELVRLEHERLLQQLPETYTIEVETESALTNEIETQTNQVIPHQNESMQTDDIPELKFFENVKELIPRIEFLESDRKKYQQVLDNYTKVENVPCDKNRKIITTKMMLHSEVINNEIRVVFFFPWLRFVEEIKNSNGFTNNNLELTSDTSYSNFGQTLRMKMNAGVFNKGDHIFNHPCIVVNKNVLTEDSQKIFERLLFPYSFKKGMHVVYFSLLIEGPNGQRIAGSCKKHANVALHENSEGRVKVLALKKIRSNDLIFMYHGKMYWKRRTDVKNPKCPVCKVSLINETNSTDKVKKPKKRVLIESNRPNLSVKKTKRSERIKNKSPNYVEDSDSEDSDSHSNYEDSDENPLT